MPIKAGIAKRQQIVQNIEEVYPKVPIFMQGFVRGSGNRLFANLFFFFNAIHIY
jgi:hypothetical protein